MTSRRKRFRAYLQDYFELRRFERYGLALVLLLSILLLVIRLSVKSISLEDQADLQTFKEIVGSDTDQTNIELQQQENNALKLIPFNPNTVSSSTLFAMGIPPSAVKSIINYRSSGFEYRAPKDLLRCYGIDEALFDQIAPFVVIVNENDRSRFAKERKADMPKGIEPSPFPFDPNEVSKEQLVAMNLPNRFIVGFLNFRNSGARFYNIIDFEKVYSLTPDLKEQLSPYLIFPKRMGDNTMAQESRNLKPIEIQRFRFDPNHISRDSLLSIGVKESVVNIWINYRKGGKQFYELSDLRSIYGLTAAQLSELSEWMDFPQRIEYRSKASVEYVQPSLNIDPNMASLEELIEIKGIGRYYANQILWNRKKLGGYYNIDQVGESERLPDSTFQSIRYHFIQPTVDSLKLINVNKTRRRAFADHPYITYDRVNHIITHREFVGRIENIEYLLKLGLLSESEAKRLRPYLVFD